MLRWPPASSARASIRWRWRSSRRPRSAASPGEAVEDFDSPTGKGALGGRGKARRARQCAFLPSGHRRRALAGQADAPARRRRDGDLRRHRWQGRRHLRHRRSGQADDAEALERAEGEGIRSSC
jgi:hypothetical protein